MKLITENKIKKKIFKNLGGNTIMRQKLIPKLFITKIFILLIFSQSIFAQQPVFTILNVTNSPDTTNYYAQYQITARTGNGETNLAANVDSIFVVFNANTTVPASIDPSFITVNSSQVNVVNITGQRLAILSPVDVAKNGGIFVLVIESNADIRNPSAAGTYTLQAATSKEPTLRTSPNYTINQSISTVTAAAVTPNPSVEGFAAAYTIGFDVGTGGFLTAGMSTITAVFPSDTYVPNGTLSGVTVNSTSASATANNNTVIITSPVNVDNNGSVQLNFTIGAGLINPTTAGSDYTLEIYTSSENTPVNSDSYSISLANQLSISAITTKPDTVNESGAFQFEFVTGSGGSLTANIDTIVVIFEQNTFLPSSISTSNVTVSSGGFSDNATSVVVKKSNTADDDSVLVVTPINIGAPASVTLTLSSGAGYLNPSVAGNYTIKLLTSKEPTAVESNPFSVFNTLTTVSQANVTPGNNSTGATTSYNINFNLGDLGRLKSGESTITLTFNSLFSISEDPAHYDASQIVIGETGPISLTAEPGGDLDPDNGAHTIQITIPSGADVNNGDNIVIMLDGTTTDPITNPTAASNYVLGVKTSVETTNINSATFNIGGSSITINSVTLTDATVNNSSQYTFSITTVTKLQSGDFIKIIFPAGTTLPGTIATTNMTINGVNPSSISVNQSAKSVTANVSQNNLNPGTFNVIILDAANVVNPTVPSSTFYKVTMYTSKDQNPVISGAYPITGDNTSVTAISASATPSLVNTSDVAYTVNFTTSSTGKIAGGTAAGSSTIILDFDAGTSVPDTIIASAVEVNSNSAQDVKVLDPGGGVVQVTMPNGLTIGNSTAVTVDFDASAGLDNVSQISNDIYVNTSSDMLADYGSYSLSTSSDLSVTAVTPNPTTQNANAGYSVKFTTGSSGALTAGPDSIRIIFPSNTYIPAAVSKNDVTVNGNNPATNPRVGRGGAGTDTLIIAVPW
jgi:hypothetical protein